MVTMPVSSKITMTTLRSPWEKILRGYRHLVEMHRPAVQATP